MKKFLLQFFVSSSIIAQTGIEVPELSHFDTTIQNFMTTHNIPGASFAMAKDGKLIYSRAFGTYNRAQTEATQPYQMFRIASISKPLTAIGIMKMVEDGKLNLSDKVFGTNGILKDHWYFSKMTISDTRVFDITVQQLLEHTAGWDRNENCFPTPTSPYTWFFGGCDPIVAPLHVTQVLGESNPVKEEHLIAFLLRNPLNNAPGTVYSYSNIGYLVLSEIIEEISDEDYESWMKEHIFSPLGVHDIFIGTNKLVDKRIREVEYISNGGGSFDLYGTGGTVPWTYRAWSVEAMDGHGGWIATAKGLTKILIELEKFTILNANSVQVMTTPSVLYNAYAKGWGVDGAGNWSHNGALDGTATLFNRANNGYSWAILLNRRVIGESANQFWSDFNDIGWNCINNITNLPNHDLFDAPTVNSNTIQTTNIESHGVSLSWMKGNGENRIVVIKEKTDDTTVIQNFPEDGKDYTSNSTFASGANLGNETYVVYNGSDSEVRVSGLKPNTAYLVQVFDYNKNSNNGNNALYLLGNSEAFTFSTKTLGTSAFTNQSVEIYPTITSKVLNIKNSKSEIIHQIDVYDLLSKTITTQKINSTHYQLDVSNLKKGVYFLKATSNQNKSAIFRFIKN